METVQNKTYSTTLELSIRRKDLIAGLPGDDPTIHNPKIGGALKGKAHLSGLSIEEEKKYLPEVIGYSPTDSQWRQQVKEYWSGISERIPHDSESTNKNLPGKVLSFTIDFKEEKHKKAFESAISFEQKAQISKLGEVRMEDVPDYILFRYCLVYSRVANNYKDINKSPKISFYLFSREQKVKTDYNEFKLVNKARTLFTSILDKESVIDAVLRLFDKNPDNIEDFPSLEDKHLELNNLITSSPKVFIDYANDKELAMKSLILKATSLGILHNPANTELYYLGSDKEILLGRSLIDTVHFLKSKEDKNVQILETIKSHLASYSK